MLNYYYLASNHQSDSYTLLFSGALLSRITPALCLNFLSVIHMDSHVITRSSMETSYTRVMGHMDVISIIQDGFNIYFPILLIVLTLATYFSLGSRLVATNGFRIVRMLFANILLLSYLLSPILAFIVYLYLK